MARHISLFQCGHLTLTHEGPMVVTDVLNQKHQLKVVYMEEIELQKEV
jgi:hypothetical protein